MAAAIAADPLVDSLDFSNACSIERPEERDLRMLLSLTLPVASSSRIPASNSAGTGSSHQNTFAPQPGCSDSSMAPPPSPSSPSHQMLPFVGDTAASSPGSSSCGSSPPSISAHASSLDAFGLGISHTSLPQQPQHHQPGPPFFSS